MNVITSMPRCGSSLVSNLIYEAVGQDRFIGLPHEFPNRIKELNPNGYFESAHSLKPYRQDFANPDDWMKLMANPLVGSRAEYIGKIVMCIRHPKVQASSKLDMHKKLQEKHGVSNEITIEPNDYISAYGKILKWCKYNFRDYPFVVNYDDLINDTINTVNGLSDYVGLTLDPIVVDAKLNRSKKIEDDKDWKLANYCYQLLKEQNFERVIKLYEAEACIPCRNKRNLTRTNK